MFGFSKRCYLDYAASMPAVPSARRAHARALRLAGNPSSPHQEGRAAKALLESARTRIARGLSAKADDVVFTSGATEANNIAIQGAVAAARRRGVLRPHALYLASCHASVVETLRALPEQGAELDPIPVADGEVSVEEIRRLIRPETVLVAMDLVCGETGAVWNAREVARELNERRVPLLVDASQAPLTELMERTRIGASMLVMDAQKIGGVRGTGVLIAPRALGIAALMHGGGQERGLRPGTEDVAGAEAFAAALAEAQRLREASAPRWASMRAELLERVRGIPGIVVNEGKVQSPRILNVSLPGRDTDYLQALLDKEGFAVATKSACETDSEEGSRAVMALTGDAPRAASTLRISWGPGVSSADLARFARALRSAVAFIDAH